MIKRNGANLTRLVLANSNDSVDDDTLKLIEKRCTKLEELCIASTTGASITRTALGRLLKVRRETLTSLRMLRVGGIFDKKGTDEATELEKAMEKRKGEVNVKNEEWMDELRELGAMMASMHELEISANTSHMVVPVRIWCKAMMKSQARMHSLRLHGITCQTTTIGYSVYLWTPPPNSLLHRLLTQHLGQNLRKLDLTNCDNVDDACVHCISVACTELRALELHGSSLTNKSGDNLASLRKLMYLGLANTGIEDGTPLLTKCSTWC